MAEKTDYEWMVETADFYRARHDEVRQENEQLRAVIDSLRAALAGVLSVADEKMKKINADHAALGEKK